MYHFLNNEQPSLRSLLFGVLPADTTFPLGTFISTTAIRISTTPTHLQQVYGFVEQQVKP